MKGSLLRKIRIVLSILFFIPLTFVLTDFSGLSTPDGVNNITYFQFVPSFLKSLTIFSLAATGFILVLVLTILFGRAYCSTICPLGFLQDVINFISKKIKRKKKKFSFLPEHKILRWALLAIPLILFLFGVALGINLLDPYSIYGKIAANFFRPIIIGANNVFSSILESLQIYSVYPYDVKIFNAVPFIVTLAFFLLVAYLSFTKGRLYCNTVCPVGTLLGFLSRFSFFKIEIDKTECSQCGICARGCKASCINNDEMSVDMSRCVACYNCIDSCPAEVITYKFQPAIKPNANSRIDNSKRSFLISTGIYFASFSSLLAQAKKQITISKPSTIPILRKNAIAPPGAKSIERFVSRCTACQLCVNACPTQVLQPSFLEYGFTGMLQPRLENNAGFCNFDCVICCSVCPTGAIVPLALPEKKLTQIGKAKFVKENCIVHTQKTDCGACSEHCPTKAVRMIPYEKNLFLPEVREEYCIGCGACEHACPTKPYKSIYVEGNTFHKLAKKNTELEQKQKEVNVKEEFPF
ncbi:MAG: 4Fe-4S binding protein [Ignavibacteriales bacterium]|nr:4Fe-4S binding protein [Ignavibacteriales bacterium]